MKYLGKLIMQQYFLGEKGLRNQMFRMEFLKILSGFYVMQKQQILNVVLMVKKENILQLRTFQKNHGEYMI